MQNEIAKPRNRKPRFIAAIAAFVGALALVFGVAMPASAATPGGIITPSSGATLSATNNTVFGFAQNPYPGGTATHAAIAICDATVTLGTACDHTAGTFTNITALTPVFGVDFYGGLIDANQSFANWDYTMNQAGNGNTTCKADAEDESGVQCAVVVSFYYFDEENPFIPIHVGEDWVPVYI